MSKTMLMIAALVCVGQCFAQSKTIEFRGVPMGASERELLAANPNFVCRDTPPDRRCSPAGNGEDKFAGHSAYQTAIFIAGRLAKVVVTMPSAYFENTVLALKEKFGPPTSIENPVFQTRGGVTTENMLVTWRLDGGMIAAVQFGTSLNELFIQYTGDATRADAEKLRQDEIKARAKSL